MRAVDGSMSARGAAQLFALAASTAIECMQLRRLSGCSSSGRRRRCGEARRRRAEAILDDRTDRLLALPRGRAGSDPGGGPPSPGGAGRACRHGPDLTVLRLQSLPAGRQSRTRGASALRTLRAAEHDRAHVRAARTAWQRHDAAARTRRRDTANPDARTRDIEPLGPGRYGSDVGSAR